MDARFYESFRALLASDDVLILVHRSPDGDCLGTAFALKRVLENLGRRVCVAASGVIDRNLRFITGGEAELKVKFLPSVIVSVDVATQKLLGSELEAYENSVDYNIDHHFTNTEFAAHNLVDGNASSAGELLFDLLASCDVPLDSVAAAHLYTAIAFDTGCFRYSNTTSHTHEVAAQLLKYSFSASEIVRLMFDSVPLRQIRMEAAAMACVSLYQEGTVALLPITRQMLKENNASDEDVSGIVSLVRRIEGVIVSATLRETAEGDIRVSLRSSDELFDTSVVSGRFGGGGHKKASGCMIKAPLDQAQEQLLAAIADEWRRVYPEGTRK